MRILLACMSVFLLAGCAGVEFRVHYPGAYPGSYPVSVPGRGAGHREAGIASFYADKYQGRLTANGERFDQYAMTAAHKTLPFDSRVRVVNVDSGRSVVVRINDRGPFIKGRIIDLSWSAFSRIESPREGLADVVIEVLE
jgi:rare lipoprotein A